MTHARSIAEGLAHQMCRRSIIAAAKPVAIGVAGLGRQMRVPILVAIVHVGLAVIFIVTTRTFHAVVKTTPLQVVELGGKGIPLRRRGWLLRPIAGLAVVHQVGHGTIVAAAESVLECFALLGRKVRVAKDFMIGDVGVAIHPEVIPCGFESLVKTLTLNVIQFLWRRVPAIAGRRRSLGRGDGARRRKDQKQSNCRECNSIEMHRTISFLRIVCEWMAGTGRIRVEPASEPDWQ